MYYNVDKCIKYRDAYIISEADRGSKKISYYYIPERFLCSYFPYSNSYRLAFNNILGVESDIEYELSVLYLLQTPHHFVCHNLPLLPFLLAPCFFRLHFSCLDDGYSFPDNGLAIPSLLIPFLEKEDGGDKKGHRWDGEEISHR